MLISEQKCTKGQSTHGSPQRQVYLRDLSATTLPFLSTFFLVFSFIKGGDSVEDLYKKPNQTTSQSLKCMSQFKNLWY